MVLFVHDAFGYFGFCELLIHAGGSKLCLLLIYKENPMKKTRFRQRGQGMTEYIIIVALVAISAIAVYQLFGQVIRSQTAAMASELAGEDGTEYSASAQNAAQAASAQTTAKSLKSFTGNAGSGGQ